MQSINFLRRYRDLLVVLVLLGLVFVFYVSNSKATRDHNALDRVVIYISSPVQWAVATTIDKLGSFWHSYVGLIHLQSENDQLRAQNAQLVRELAQREEERLENRRLRRLVGLQEQLPEVKMVFARVIGTSPSPLFRSLRLDVGTREGISLGAAVVSDEGVVGRVAAITDNQADVMLLVDANSSTDVLVQRTRARGRVRGRGGDGNLGIELQNLARSADVRPGDVLVTSGVGAVLPKGLKVGEVMAVEKRAFGLYQQASVKPAVDFGRLEAVMVILPGYPTSTNFADEQAESKEEGSRRVGGVAVDGLSGSSSEGSSLAVEPALPTGASGGSTVLP